MGFRVRYTIDTKPKQYYYSVIEERWNPESPDKFDNKETFELSGATMRQFMGCIPSYGQQPIRIMWILVPNIYMEETTYTSPLNLWLSSNPSPFQFATIRYFPHTGESLESQATRCIGRFKGQ